MKNARMFVRGKVMRIEKKIKIKEKGKIKGVK